VNEVKAACGKNTKWLLFKSDQLRNFARVKGGIMKKNYHTGLRAACAAGICADAFDGHQAQGNDH
jgi:hypothetical protein